MVTQSKESTGKNCKMANVFGRFGFPIEYKEGKSNVIADCIS
jgi:hypothetical protein